MRVLHVVRQFAPSIGGLETYVRVLVQYQSNLGLHCGVLTLDRIFESDKGRLGRREQCDGVHVRRVGFVGGRRMFVPLVSGRLLRSYDIVHVHNTDGFFDSLSIRRIGVPMVATTHGGFFHTRTLSGVKQAYFEHVTRRTCRNYKLLFANSKNDYETFSAIHPRVVLAPNAVEAIGRFVTAGKDILCLGRLARHKRVDRIIRTFSLLSRTQPDQILHIVGPEWDVKHGDLHAVAAECGVRERVRFHGVLPNDSLRKLCRSCGFFWSASEYEGFGMTLVEAMSVGLLPFVQPNASFRELIGAARVGWLVDFSDRPHAAQIIADRMQSCGRVDRLAATMFSRRFDWPTLAARTVDAYRQYLDEVPSDAARRAA